MKISSIRVFQVDLPLVEGRYSWSEGKFVEVFDSTVVELVTDDGLSGFGEVCPLGPFYLPAFGAGARAGIAEPAPTLIGEDPTAVGPINRLMDGALLGHPYVKSAIDMACWDLLGKVTGKSVCDLLGGKFGDSVALYRAISQRPADEMAENVAAHRADGYTKFQLKVGGHPTDDIARIHAVADILTDGEVLVADANTGWRVDGKTHWLWCFTTPNLTYYMIDRSRGSPALMKFFTQEFSGTLVSDFWGAYNAVACARRQTCLVHLLRDL